MSDLIRLSVGTVNAPDAIAGVNTHRLIGTSASQDRALSGRYAAARIEA